MTNPATDFVASSVCPAYSARSPCARDAVHRFALPGMGFRAVHGLLGIFLKKGEEVTRGHPGTLFPRARNFSKNGRASVRFAKTYAPQGTTANGQGLGARGSVRHPVRCPPPELAPPTHARTPPRAKRRAGVIALLGQSVRAAWAPLRARVCPGRRKPMNCIKSGNKLSQKISQVNGIGI